MAYFYIYKDIFLYNYYFNAILLLVINYRRNKYEKKFFINYT